MSILTFINQWMSKDWDISEMTTSTSSITHQLTYIFLYVFGVLTFTNIYLDKSDWDMQIDSCHKFMIYRKWENKESISEIAYGELVHWSSK